MYTRSASELEPIAHKYVLRLIVLLGSQVTGHTHLESDADVFALLVHHLSCDERKL